MANNSSSCGCNCPDWAKFDKNGAIVEIIRAPSDVIGSGFVTKSKRKKILFVVTCVHVIENVEKGKLWIRFQKSRDLHQMEVCRQMLDRDLAVLKFVNSLPDDMIFLELEDQEPKEGDPICLIGHPFGLSYLKSPGFVIFPDEDIKWHVMGELTCKSGIPIAVDHLLLHSAGDGCGYSGGPIINKNGKVVSIHSFSTNFNNEFWVGASMKVKFLKTLLRRAEEDF